MYGFIQSFWLSYLDYNVFIAFLILLYSKKAVYICYGKISIHLSFITFVQE